MEPKEDENGMGGEGGADRRPFRHMLFSVRGTGEGISSPFTCEKNTTLIGLPE